MRPVRRNTWVLLLFILGMSGCASELRHTPTRFAAPAGEQVAPITIHAMTEVSPASGYAVTLKAGSVWDYAGRIPEGAAFRIRNNVFMLEGAHRHEAYCVVNENRLVGFFLPVEQAFVAVNPAVPFARQ